MKKVLLITVLVTYIFGLVYTASILGKMEERLEVVVCTSKVCTFIRTYLHKTGVVDYNEGCYWEALLQRQYCVIILVRIVT